MCNLKKMIQMNLFTKQKQTHSYRKQIYGYQRGKGEGRINQEFGISRCKLLYIEWIKNKVLLYSTGNCTQYFVITCKGKEPEKEYLSIYISICPSIYLNHCAVHIKLTQHCKSTILQIKKLMKKSGRVFLLIGSHGLLITMTT